MNEAEHAEQRRWWRIEWLTRVQELADLEMQRATWLNPRAWNPHYSFVEYVTTYLDVADWSFRVDEGLLSEVEARSVASLDDLVRAYRAPNGDFDHAAILTDPKWLEVIHVAQQAQKQLAHMIVDQDERLALLEPSEHALLAIQAD